MRKKKSPFYFEVWAIRTNKPGVWKLEGTFKIERDAIAYANDLFHVTETKISYRGKEQNHVKR